MLTNKQKATEKRRQFLLSFFELPHDSYALKEINGFVLNRYIHGETKKTYVMIYTKKSWKKMKDAINTRLF